MKNKTRIKKFDTIKESEEDLSDHELKEDSSDYESEMSQDFPGIS